MFLSQANACVPSKVHLYEERAVHVKRLTQKTDMYTDHWTMSLNVPKIERNSYEQLEKVLQHLPQPAACFPGCPAWTPIQWDSLLQLYHNLSHSQSFYVIGARNLQIWSFMP